MIISIEASGVSHAVTWSVIISRWFRRNRGLAIGLAVTGPLFGTPIVILNAQIVEAYGWRAVLIGYGIVVLIGVTLLSVLVRDRPEPYGLRPDGDPPEEAASPEQYSALSARRLDAGLTLDVVLRTKEFWLFTFYLSGTFTVNSAFQVHMIPYFQQEIGLTAAWAGRGHVYGVESSAASDGSAAAICWTRWTIASCSQPSPRSWVLPCCIFSWWRSTPSRPHGRSR